MAVDRQRAVTTWGRLFALPLSTQALDVGLLLVRITVGLAFILHGWPKIQHPFSWAHGILAAPPIFQFAAAIAEFVGGIAILVGLATRLFAFLLFCDMFTAIALVQIPHGARFVATHGGRSYGAGIHVFDQRHPALFSWSRPLCDRSLWFRGRSRLRGAHPA